MSAPRDVRIRGDIPLRHAETRPTLTPQRVLRGSRWAAFVLRLRKFEMTMFSFPRSFSLAFAGLLVTSAFTAAASADDAEAVIRLKAKPEGVVHVRSTPANSVVRGQSPQEIVRPVHGEYSEPQNCPQQESSSEACPGECREYAFDRLMMHLHMTVVAPIGCKMHYHCREKRALVRDKLGYFIPTGNCGQGTPPFGHYSMVYPVNPQHFDGRDGQVYAAQGYGGPVAMPIAPVVNHTYNYGWGMPSSRLTPISHPVSPAQVQAYQNNYAP